jgi:hypothetical protein
MSASFGWTKCHVELHPLQKVMYATYHATPLHHFDNKLLITTPSKPQNNCSKPGKEM